jgi:hypothetical protein
MQNFQMKLTASFTLVSRTALAAAILTAGLGHAAPEGPDVKAPPALAIAPIFGELFATAIPSGFKLQEELTKGSTYQRSMILASDPGAGPWTQRFLVQGTADLGAVPGTTAAQYALQIATNFRKACPNTFTGGRVLEGRIKTGHLAYTMVVACGSHTLTADAQPTSEITLVTVVKGDKNIYSVQWSDRAAPLDKAPSPDRLLIQQRLSIMTSMLVCAPVEGEAAPYPSCTQR